MMEEIDPRYWIAPALRSGNTFLEPMQGGSLKTMGVLKPWAPPRSYGLVIRLDDAGPVRYSLHSRVDGKHHGIIARGRARWPAVRAVARASGACCACRSPRRKRAWRRMSATAPILELRKATKKYAGVPAIEDVDFELLAGEVHALRRRERRRQVDADQGDGGRGPAHARARCCIEGRERQLRDADRGARRSASRWCSRRPAWCRR